jgi:hypothetical protein
MRNAQAARDGFGDRALIADCGGERGGIAEL